MDEAEILLIEGDPSHAELTLMALKETNVFAKIYVAKDGEEALNFLFSRDRFETGPKFILLELDLPKKDGLEVLRKIRMDERSRSIPVIVLTSSQNDRDIMMSYECGANSYIVKPMESDAFVSTIGELGYYWLRLNQQPTM